MRRGISVVLPAYKEAENLKLILPQIKEILEDLGLAYEILVIDTQTPMDDTEVVCNNNESTYVARKNGNTYGDAIRTGFDMAQYDYIVIMDADGSHNPNDIERLYREIKECNADVVIGSRYIEGGKTDNPAILIFMSYIVNLMYRFVFGIKVKDVSDSFRIYQTRLLKNLELACDNFDIVEEILIRLKKQKKDLCIKEIPICFSKRMYGESKRDLFKFVCSYITTMWRLYVIMHR